MKKQFLVAMAALSMVTLAGCSAKEAAPAATTAAATEAAKETEAATEAVTEAAETEAALDPDCRLAKVLESGKLMVGVSPDFAPMEFKDPTKTGDDMYVGSDMAMARYICEQMGFQSLGYQTIDGLLEAIGLDRDKVCTYCWDGRE